MTYKIDYSTIKKPNQDAPLTPEQEEEWYKCALDPMYFFTNYCFVVGDKGKVLYQPRCYQEGIIETIEKNNLSVCLAPRQSGKCSSASTNGLAIVVVGGVQYKLILTMEQIHQLAKCETPQEADKLLKDYLEKQDDAY